MPVGCALRRTVSLLNFVEIIRKLMRTQESLLVRSDAEREVSFVGGSNADFRSGNLFVLLAFCTRLTRWIIGCVEKYMWEMW